MNPIKTDLTEMLGIKYPIIMAPMFLVSNAKMTIEGIKAGATGAIPALNYRTDVAFREALEEIKNSTDGPFGINLIVNKSNVRLKEQLQTCVDYNVDYIITSLGSPRAVIEACANIKTKIFCDVTEDRYAKKVEELGADAVIAVNSEAGGHAGKLVSADLIPLLRSTCKIPVISAGGVGTGLGLKEKLDLGASGVSIGSPFIATVEAGVSQEYKQAIVDYGADDIVMTTKLSGTPCTVINTPYVKEIGTEQTWLETVLNKNRTLKKYTKMITFYKGMKSLEKAASGATYKTVWCAGPSIEHVHTIKPIKDIIETLVREYEVSFK